MSSQRHAAKKNADKDNVEDTKLYDTLSILGMSDFIKQQANGLSTQLFPQGKQLSNSISKKILLARAIIKEPKMLLLENPLEYLEKGEVEDVINYLSDRKRPWGLVVISNNEVWNTKCDEVYNVKVGNLLTTFLIIGFQN